MSTQYQLKPFYINISDLAYLLAQVNFVPLFDGPANSNGIVDFDPATMDAWDANGNQVWDAEAQSGSYKGTVLNAGNVDLLGQGFPHVSSSTGVRDVSGLHNNLFGDQAFWGAVDVPFRRDIPADFSNYVTNSDNAGGVANYTPGQDVIDYMPRIISNTITSGGINLLKDGTGGFVEWDPSQYTGGANEDANYVALIDASGVDIAQLVEGAKIVAPEAAGLTLLWDATADSASIQYVTLLNLIAGGSPLAGGATGNEPLVDGGQIYKFDGTNYVQLNGLTFDATLFLYHSLIVESGVTNPGSLAAGTPIIVTNADVSDAIVGLSATGAVTQATGEALLVSDPTAGSGYGLLEQLGHIDFQNPNSGEYFIGSENPGVAPVNSWFGIFGQFFDHGLDLIGKGGNGKITIALDPSDPLYRAPGTNGATDQGVTKMTVTRASIAGTDANGDPNYINHTSPFIDQSQTYGSVDQITQLLRKWVSTDGGTTYQAGIELFDGQTLAETWTRRWPDGTTKEVRDTLPTLAELRDHVLDTGRDGLTWEDVADYRNRDASGHLTAGSSGHALILDMNPVFDGAHLDSTAAVGTTTVAALVDGAVNTLNASLAGSGMTFSQNSTGNIELVVTGGAGGQNLPDGTYTGAFALAPWVNFADFSIMAPPPGPVGADEIKSAVGEILMATVGDHYIAGDGRVNENFGLTSIHHVFHEEHNYQVENLKSWIYQHDENSSPLTHDGLHAWQVNTGEMDLDGNYLNADGSVAWDANKMFDATKLLVEMEYQHAAVDQYARTVTPRIQEFVGYSTGVDSTVSLEYSQVAFRFGHSTIRETIDTIDPSGWMLGNVTRFALEKAFLAPQTFAQEGVAAITLGLSRQQMNEVDEFVTPALTQGLLDQPLDLPAINIARGRDLGIPTLNDFREAISLARYTSWGDFGNNMIHPESLVNFIAAYSFGGDLAKAQAIVGLYDGSIVEGATAAMGYSAADAIAFMLNNATADAELNAARTGFDHIDSWIGGLAEAHVPGGLLGETFDAVFVAQIQSLMDGDRFYYLYRLFGTNIHEEVNNGQFKDIVERNTGLSHLNGSIFAYADKYYEFGRAADGTLTGTGDDVANHLYHDKLAANPTLGIYSDGGASTDLNGTTVSIVGSDFVRPDVTNAYIRDVRPELDPDQVHTVEGTPTSGADSHEVIVATDNADYIHARSGDDTVYGEGGDDFIYGDGGVDRLYGGAGDDMIDTGEGPDLADGGAGKDIIYGRGSGSEVGGFDQLVGGSGNDLIIGGEGIDKLSGGAGDDIIYGDGLTNPEMGNTDPFTHGGDGNDYIDGGASGDLLFGEEGDDYIVGGVDQDLMQGGSGDDIIRPGKPSQASGTTGGPDEVVGDDGQANSGFDLIDFSDYTGNAPGITVDFATQNNPLVNIDQTTTFPAWFQIEGAIGTQNGDTFIGDSTGDATATNSLGNNWLIGGSGSDKFTGAGGNDLIVGGSVRLDVLIGKYADAANASGPANLTVGSSEWLADAMHTGGVGGANDGYDGDTEDAYTGASNQANGLLSGGLLAGAGFDLHFTDMLKSRMFKDVVLGDNGIDGTSDTAIFTGSLAKYTLVALDGNGNVVNNPHANWASVLAIKVTDNRTAADLLDANGAPLVDANGNPLVNEGTDLIVGVEKFQFADQTIDPEAYFDLPPVVDLNYVPIANVTTLASDNFDGQGQSYSRGSGWTGSWTEAGDDNSPSNGDIQDSGNSLIFGSGTDNNDSIRRAVNLNGQNAATLSFDYTMSDLESGKNMRVEAWNATTSSWQTIASLLGSGGGVTVNNGHLDVDLTTSQIGSASQIRFRAEGSWSNNDGFNIDNVEITHADGTFHDGAPGLNHAIDYTEQQANAPAITNTPLVTDADDATILSAKIVIRDPIAGDQLNAGALPSGISATGNGTGASGLTGATQITLSGSANHASYQAALTAITFSNPTNDNPTEVDRHVDVTVNDGLKDSPVATTTVNFATVNDAPTLANDTVVTNVGLNVNFAIADWTLLANDVDPDSAMTISGIGNGNGIATSGNGAGHNGSTVTIRDTTGGANTFSYSVSVSGPDPSATVTVVQQAGNTLNGAAAGEILTGTDATTVINGGDGNDIVLGNGGNDTLRGDGGDDTIVYTVTTSGGPNLLVTSGRDSINGGANAAVDPVGDRFILNGQNGAETFKIMTRAIAESTLTAAQLGALQSGTEIVITRQTGNAASGVFTNAVVVAELDDIEEITVNGAGVTVAQPPATAAGDNIQIIGNFNTTSLNFNTITINGGVGNDDVDISGLTSDHRIVFNSGMGNDSVTGTLRPQDVVSGNASRGILDNVRGGHGNDVMTAADGDGCDNYYGGGGSDTYDASDSSYGLRLNLNVGFAIGAGTGRDTLSSIENANGGEGDDVLVGSRGANRLSGGEGDDYVSGLSGNDRLLGGEGDDVLNGGAGRDLLYGGEGSDTMSGGAGRDVLNGGRGDDKMSGGSGGDTFVFQAGFGNDAITGFDANAAGGQDKLDIRALGINSNNFAAEVHILQSGHDTLILLDGEEIRLKNVDYHSVTHSDFVLAA